MQRLEALGGPCTYSQFLRKHDHRPDREQAVAIGRLMGGRVRASDGSMQPELTIGEKAAIRSIKKRRKDWSSQCDHIQRTIAAIGALSQNQHEPSTVIAYGTEAFANPALREQLDFALNWLMRFAEESRRYEYGSRPKGPQLIVWDNQ